MSEDIVLPGCVRDGRILARAPVVEAQRAVTGILQWREKPICCKTMEALMSIEATIDDVVRRVIVKQQHRGVEGG